MRTYIITANYLNLHKIFLYFENKYGQTGKTASKTDGAAIRATIKDPQLSVLLRGCIFHYRLLENTFEKTKIPKICV